MHYPLIDKELLSVLQSSHATFNVVVMLLFWHQAWMGMKIRKARRQAGGALPFTLIRRHRKAGPVYAALALFGYLFGIVIVVLHKGRLLEHPAHFFTGTILIAVIMVSIVLSRRIQGQQSPYRTAHFIAGLFLLVLYLLQVLLGIGVLF